MMSSHPPDSPRSSQSPAPEGVQGDLELELLGLANALYNLGTTVINDSTKDRDKPGGAKQVGPRACVLSSTSCLIVSMTPDGQKWCCPSPCYYR